MEPMWETAMWSPGQKGGGPLQLELLCVLSKVLQGHSIASTASGVLLRFSDVCHGLP